MSAEYDAAIEVREAIVSTGNEVCLSLNELDKTMGRVADAIIGFAGVDAAGLDRARKQWHETIERIRTQRPGTESPATSAEPASDLPTVWLTRAELAALNNAFLRAEAAKPFCAAEDVRLMNRVANFLDSLDVAAKLRVQAFIPLKPDGV